MNIKNNYHFDDEYKNYLEAYNTGYDAAKSSSNTLSSAAKLGTNALKFIYRRSGPIFLAMDVIDTARNPKMNSKLDWIQPVKVFHTISHKTPGVKDVLKKSDRFFGNIGSKIHDMIHTDKSNDMNSENTESSSAINKSNNVSIDSNSISNKSNTTNNSNNITNNKSQFIKLPSLNTLALIGGIGAAGVSGALLYKYIKNRSTKNMNKSKSFDEHNTLAAKMYNFGALGSLLGAGAKVARASKNTLKFLWQGKNIPANEVTHNGGIKGALKNTFTKTSEPFDAKTINQKQVNISPNYKNIGYTIGGTATLGYVAPKVVKTTRSTADTVTNIKDSLIHNKELENKSLNNALIGAQLAGATALGAATGGIPGAILAPLGGYLGYNYGPAGKVAGATVGLVAGSITSKYLKKIRERQKKLGLVK